jgi:hypothetical protein
MGYHFRQAIVADGCGRIRVRSVSIDSAMVRKLFDIARVRALCYANVLKLDVAKTNAQTVEFPIMSNYLTHAWDPEEYQTALSRIRDFGVMNGLTARDISFTFCDAHTDAASGLYK